jgi:hypothetical protein
MPGLPCLANPGKIIVSGQPNAAIDGALPPPNVILPNVASYHHSHPAQSNTRAVAGTRPVKHT